MEMQPLSLCEARVIQLRLLDQFAEFCRDHGLRWFLCGGTLLGAVRHSGYIPWDDDIDIMMLRADYERMCELLALQPLCGASIVCLRSDADYPFPYAKFSDVHTRAIEPYDPCPAYGVNIDIFPIDIWSGGSCAIKVQRTLVLFIRYLLGARISTGRMGRGRAKSVILRMIKQTTWFVEPNKLGRLVDRVARRSGSPASPSLGIIVWGCMESVPKSCFASTVDLKFEGRTLPAPIGWDRWLKEVYGDYMDLPPVDERVTHHSVDFYRTGQE